MRVENPLFEALEAITGARPPEYTLGLYSSAELGDRVLELQDWCCSHARPWWSTGIAILEAADAIVDEAIGNTNIEPPERASLAEVCKDFRAAHLDAFRNITKMYPEIDRPQDLEPFRSRHLMAMTEERLDSKADIVDQLALRDRLIADEEEQTIALRLRLPRYPLRISEFARALYPEPTGELPTDADHTNALCVDFGFDPQHETTWFVAGQLAARDAEIARLKAALKEVS